MGQRQSSLCSSAAAAPAPSETGLRYFEADVSKIGTGLLGGKVECLAAVAQALQTESIRNPKIAGCVVVPHMYVIATDFFDGFMAQNDLVPARLESMSDAEISLTFANATLPGRLTAELGALLERVRTPLVVRSSGLLETALYHAAAAPYAARILPNSEPSFLYRLEELKRAVKAVWGSLFSSRAKAFSKGCGRSLCEEKMAVVIQEVFGRKTGNLFYPDVSCRTVSPQRSKGYRFERTAIVEAVPGLMREEFSDICRNDDQRDDEKQVHGPWAIDLSSPYREEDVIAARCRLVAVPEMVAVQGLGTRAPVIDPTVLMEAPVDDLLALGEWIVGGPVEIHFAVRASRGAASGAETAVLKVTPTFDRP